MCLSSPITVPGLVLASRLRAKAAPQTGLTKPPPTSTTPAPKTTTPSGAPARAPSNCPIAINTALTDQLGALPQVGPARAGAIIRGHPYKAKSEVLAKKIIRQNAFDAIYGRIVAIPQVEVRPSGAVAHSC
jgi:competence protein ComEA